jgi:hypothetical protein
MCVSWKHPAQNWQLHAKRIKVVHLIPSWIQSTSKHVTVIIREIKLPSTQISKCYSFNAAKLKAEHLLVVLTSILFCLLIYQTQ